MRKLLAILCLFALAMSARAASYSSYYLVFTNSTANGYSNTINGTVSRWTNAPANTVNWLTTGSSNVSATNFFLFLGQNYPALITSMASSNVVTLGGLGLTFSITGPFGYTTNASLTVTQGQTVMWPGASLFPSNRIGQASDIAFELVQSTNAIAPNAVALTNYAGLTNAGTLTRKALTSPWITGGTNSGAVVTNATIQKAASISGTVDAFTGGSATNLFITNSPSILATNARFTGKLTATNAIIDGLTATNFSSPGSGVGSIHIGGDSSDASGGGSISFGFGSVATNLGSMVIGSDVINYGYYSIAIGDEVQISDVRYAIVIGTAAQGTANDVVAIGTAAVAGYSNSVALGAAATSTTTNQIRLGTSSEHVSIPGELRDSRQTNVWFTGTNRFDLAVAFTATNITTLANGVNLVDPGFKTTLRISGPTAAYSIDKITRGYNERFLRIRKNDPYTLTIANESGSGGGAATDRVLTGTGANATVTNYTGTVELSYDETLGRWIMGFKSN